MSDVLADRTPPHNIEAEQAVLGAILLEQDALTTASELSLPESFLSNCTSKRFLKLCLGSLIKENRLI